MSWPWVALVAVLSLCSYGIGFKLLWVLSRRCYRNGWQSLDPDDFLVGDLVVIGALALIWPFTLPGAYLIWSPYHRDGGTV